MKKNRFTEEQRVTILREADRTSGAEAAGLPWPFFCARTRPASAPCLRVALHVARRYQLRLPAKDAPVLAATK